MPRVVVLAILLVGFAAHAEPRLTTASATSPPPARANQLRLDLGIGGPGGLMAVRYSRVLPRGMRIEPAVGLGYTGLLGSLLVTQPLMSWDRRTKDGTAYTTALEVYGGYSLSVLRDNLYHPWAGRQSFVPSGNYHWFDFGVSVQTLFRGVVFTMGSGASVLMAAPMNVGASPDDEDADTLWWLFPEGWMQRQHWVPSLWSSVGYSF